MTFRSLILWTAPVALALLVACGGGGGGATTTPTPPPTPVPVLTSFSPLSGPVGTTVTLSGANFSGASTVRFNGTADSTFTVNSATQITAKVPAGATTGTLSVTTPGGVATSSSVFSVVDPAPTLVSIQPTGGPVGTTVTLTGTHFTGVTTVSFNGTAALSFSPGGATTLTAVVPLGATSGNVTVTTPGGTSNGLGFTVTAPPVGTRLVYADPTTGTYRLLRNASLSSDRHLVLDLVGSAADSGTGIALALQAGSTHVVWANVNAGDPAGTWLANGTTFNLGGAPQVLRATLAGDTLRVVAAEKGLGGAKPLGTVLLRVALDLKPDATPAPGSTIQPTALASACKIMQADGSTKVVPIAIGLITVQ